MSSDLTKKAVDMLLHGATLLSEPCPYCKGVRVMKDGHALCISCGKEPKAQKIKPKIVPKKRSQPTTMEILEKKLNSLSAELENEKDHKKQKQILESINSLIETISKLKEKQ